MDIVPPGGRIVEVCQHGNPMDAACKLCGRVGNPDAVISAMGIADPNRELKDQLLATAFGLLASVDGGKASKQSEDWQASSAEWVEQYGKIAAPQA